MVSLFLLSPPPPPPLAPVIGTHEGEKFNIWPSTDLSPSLSPGGGRKRRPLDAARGTISEERKGVAGLDK